MDGTPWDFEIWRAGEPNGGINDDIIGMVGKGWGDYGGSHMVLQSIVCQKGL